MTADDVREEIARALALTDDYDGCFERLDGTDPNGEEPLSTDEEDANWWRKRADAILPILARRDWEADKRGYQRGQADGWDEGHAAGMREVNDLARNRQRAAPNPHRRTDEAERCLTCGIDKRYPTALHLVDCSTDENGDRDG